MTTIRKIVTSKIDGNHANSTDTNEIRPFGETAFYLDNNKLTLMMFDGVRTHQQSKVLSPGVLYGSNADSGDGAGLDTIKLIPDARLHYDFGDGNNHQHLIIDPTAPNHIHIRAGGSIDNSNADLFLGGELTHVKVSDGYDNVVIRTSTLGEGVTPHAWTFGNNGYLTFPDGTESSGQGIWPPVDGGLGITLTRNVELSAVAAVDSGEGALYIDTSENDDISVVNTFWQLNTGTPTAPILTPVTNSITLEPGIYVIFVSGFTFVPGENYTFRNNSIDAVDWVFMPTGELRTSGLGTISHYPGSTSSLKFEVPSSNDIVLRTAGGDLTYGADGNLTLPNGGAIRIDGANVEVGGMTDFNVEALGVVNVYTNDGAHRWQFSDDGALSLPANGVIKSSTYSGFSLRSRYDEPINNLVGSNILVSPGQVSINYQVEDQGVPTPGYQWDFNYVTQALDLADGGLKFADNTVQTTAWTGSVSLISSGPTAPGSAVVAGTSDIDFNFSDGVSTAVSITRDSQVVSAKAVGLTLASNFDVKIVTDFTDNNRTWTFNGTDGSITFPDNTVQTTAYTGSDTGAITFTGNEIEGNTFGGTGTTFSKSVDKDGSDYSTGGGTLPFINMGADSDVDNVRAGWIVTFASGETRTVASDPFKPLGTYWNISFNSSYSWSAGDVMPITFSSPDYVAGTDPEVTLTAGTESWTFDDAGGITFPDGNVQSTAYAGGVGHMMMIDTNRTDTYTEVGSADCPFKTFAAAIAAATASDATTFTFVLMGCTVTENVNFNGSGLTAVTISTACRSNIDGNITIADNPELSQLVVRNVEIGGTFTLTGDATSEQMNSCSFYNVSFTGAVNITATNATAFYEASFFSTVALTNISYLYINGAQFNDDWTITADDTGTYPIPSRGINPGTGGSLSVIFGTIANNVYFVKGGTAAYVFQPHMTRLGRTTGTYTIPAGWTVSAYGADFRGTWTNNGAMGLKISGTDNRVLGTAPSYSSIVGGDRVVADLAPASSKGVAGDRASMIAVGGGYLYVCTADWTNGVADIWTRTALTTGAW